MNPLYYIDFYFKEVFTTNSFNEWQSTEFLTVYDCIPYLLSKVPA
jgi:hypothetical protein